MAYITTIELKKHLNIEDDFFEDDNYLNDLIAVSELAIQNYCNGGLIEFDNISIPVTIKQACLLLSAHFYNNRQIVSFANGVEIPYTFQFLLNQYKTYSIF